MVRLAIVGFLVVCLAGCVDGGFRDPATALGDGEAALGRGDYAAANDHFTDALVAVAASEAQKTEAYRGRGAARLGLDRLEEAVEDYATAIARAPEQPRLRLGRAEAYRRLGDQALALLDLTAAIRLDASYADAFLARAALHTEMAAFAKAIADFERAAELGGAPDAKAFAAAHAGRAAAHKKVGTYQEAIEDFSRAIALDTENPAYHRGRGLTYLESGQLEEGIADLSRAGGVSIDDFHGQAKLVGEISFPPFTPKELAGVPDSTLQKFAGFARVSGGLWANQRCEHLDGAQKLGFEFEARKNEQNIREVYRSLLGVDAAAAEMFLEAVRKIGVAYALDQSNECGEPSRRLVSDGLAEAVCLNVFFDGTQFEGCDY